MTLKDDVSALTEAVSALTKRFDEKEAKEQARIAPGTVEKPALPQDAALNLALDGESDDIPSSYRAQVNESLNKSFGIHIRNGGGNFKFTILVPEKYSSLNAEQRKMLGFDLRPKVIDNAEGVNGVKLWCDRVFSSFNPAIQAQIVGDRLAVL